MRHPDGIARLGLQGQPSADRFDAGRGGGDGAGMVENISNSLSAESRSLGYDSNLQNSLSRES